MQQDKMHHMTILSFPEQEAKNSFTVINIYFI